MIKSPALTGFYFLKNFLKPLTTQMVYVIVKKLRQQRKEKIMQVTAPIKKADKTKTASAPREFNVIEQAIVVLSGVCDGAHSQDGQGFNGTDTGYGKSLAVQLTTSNRPLSHKQATGAIKMLKKYSKQLIKLGVAIPTADDFNRLYPYPFRAEIIDGEVAVFCPYSDSGSLTLENPKACYNSADRSYRYLIEDAYVVNKMLPNNFQRSDEFMNAAIPCGF